MDELVQSLLDFRPGGFPLGRIALVVLSAAAALAASALLRRILLRAASRLSGLPAAALRRLSRPCGVLLAALGMELALRLLQLPGGLVPVWEALVTLSLVAGGTWMAIALADSLIEMMAERSGHGHAHGLAPLFRNLARAVLAILGVVVLLQLYGVQIGALVAGLGIGGLAFALAAQDSLSGFFASVAIILDKPFRVGDFISTGGVLGTVQDIGIRSTRLVTVDRTLVSIPNRKLVESVIDNWSERETRRTAMKVGIEYSSGADGVRRLLGELRSMLGSHPSVERGTFTASFGGFGESSLEIELAFHVLTTDYAEWLAAREDICLRTMGAVEACGLSFAFPTRTVKLDRGGEA